MKALSLLTFLIFVVALSSTQASAPVIKSDGTNTIGKTDSFFTLSDRETLSPVDAALLIKGGYHEEQRLTASENYSPRKPKRYKKKGHGPGKKRKRR